MAINVYSNPFTSPSKCTTQYPTGTSGTYINRYATSMIFPDGCPVCYVTVSGAGTCDCGDKEIPICVGGDCALIDIMGYICKVGTCCIYTLDFDDVSNPGRVTYCSSGTSNYCMLFPPAQGCYGFAYNYIAWYIDK